MLNKKVCKKWTFTIFLCILHLMFFKTINRFYIKLRCSYVGKDCYGNVFYQNRRGRKYCIRNADKMSYLWHPWFHGYGSLPKVKDEEIVVTSKEVGSANNQQEYYPWIPV